MAHTNGPYRSTAWYSTFHELVELTDVEFSQCREAISQLEKLKHMLHLLLHLT